MFRSKLVYIWAKVVLNREGSDENEGIKCAKKSRSVHCVCTTITCSTFLVTLVHSAGGRESDNERRRKERGKEGGERRGEEGRSGSG